MKKPTTNDIDTNNTNKEEDDTGTSATISESALLGPTPSANTTKQQKKNKNKNKKKLITIDTNTQKLSPTKSPLPPPPPKESVEIFVKSFEITNIISSMLSSSPHFEKYAKEDKDTSEILKKYTDIKQSSNDPNQTVYIKNNSPFYMLDNKEDKKPNSQQQQQQQQQQKQKTKEIQKSKDLMSMTKNHLENILGDNNKKQNSYMSAQNNNNSFRYQPYGNNKFSRGSEENESKSSSINKTSKFIKNNSAPKKVGMWD
ncbi:hypothetical protein RB653_002608 [Dictyostelium firmibasis]|uniref:Uncharacterized protein n=1 Tax=Dictyostelium firmibasis TaxID=79012 RepID=A0AAN7TQZ7_9MYCE